jgi:hypothetical protein
MHDENTPKMSVKTADVLFGQSTVTLEVVGQSTGNDFERDLYELRKLADQVLEAMAANEAQEMAFRGAKGGLPYGRPELDSAMVNPSQVPSMAVTSLIIAEAEAFTLPLPSWEEA